MCSNENVWYVLAHFQGNRLGAGMVFQQVVLRPNVASVKTVNVVAVHHVTVVQGTMLHRLQLKLEIREKSNPSKLFCQISAEMSEA